MKNAKKLFLIFFLVFGFLVLNAGIADAAITDGLPADIGGFSNLTVFDFSASGNPYLITGQERLVSPESFDGYRWGGASWADSTVDSGLPDSITDSSPAIFTRGGNWYLVTGKTDGTFDGFERPGGAGPWIASTIENGLVPVGGNWSTPTIFSKDGFSSFPTGQRYLITGKQNGTFDGYRWGGANWVADAGITSGLSDVGHNSTITVFEMGANWYAITGDGNGKWKSFRWGGVAWVVDTVIDNGLPAGYFNTAPEVFEISGTHYLIFGEHDGRFFGFHWNDIIKSWVEEVVDNTPPVVDSLTISDGVDTYRGGITTFNTLGNITINATAHDEVGGSGLSDFRIYWYYQSAPATTYSSANGAGSGSASATINLSTHAGDTIHYYAKAKDSANPQTVCQSQGVSGNEACADIGGICISGSCNGGCSGWPAAAGACGCMATCQTPNITQSPSWGEWCINVKAEPAGAFSYTSSCEAKYQGMVTLDPLHTFIFPAKAGTRYNISGMSHHGCAMAGVCGTSRFSYQINAGAVITSASACTFNCWVHTDNDLAPISTNNNEKLKVIFNYAGQWCWVTFKDETVTGSAITCVANGGACGAHAECCSGHCQNGICCDAGHTCCANDGHCPADSCVDACHLNDHYCDTATDHYCKNNTTHCPIASTACAGGVCAAANLCGTGHCQFPTHEICDLQCDSGGNCIIVLNCVDHCINGVQDCSEAGIDCGGACPNPCCTPTCFINPGCSTVAIPNAVVNGALVCCGLGESCYECATGYSWDGANCTALCAWQDDGCGAHGCNAATHRGELCGPVGCIGGPCSDGAINCVPDIACCIPNGNPYTGDPTVECCSTHGENGYCCAVGNICCNADAHCPAAGCSGLCSIDDGTCDMVAHTCGTALADCLANTSCSGNACANTNYCDTGVCRNGGLHQICDKWCDGLGGCNNWTNCIDHCSDGSQNCGETEIDCGGPNCDPCCHDLDSDGYDDCDSGANDDGNPIDCCDSGLEGSLGCAMGTRAGINPGATEICENLIDEDCDGVDLPCCHWQDDGCGKHDCDIWTHRGEICLPDPCTGGVGCSPGTTQCIEDDLCSTFGLPDRTILEILLDVVDWLLGIIAALAFLMIVIGGTIYLSSSGNPTRIETAKKIVTYAIIGLVIAGVSYSVVHVVFDVLQ